MQYIVVRSYNYLCLNEKTGGRKAVIQGKNESAGGRRGSVLPHPGSVTDAPWCMWCSWDYCWAQPYEIMLSVKQRHPLNNCCLCKATSQCNPFLFTHKLFWYSLTARKTMFFIKQLCSFPKNIPHLNVLKLQTLGFTVNKLVIHMLILCSFKAYNVGICFHSKLF